MMNLNADNNSQTITSLMDTRYNEYCNKQSVPPLYAVCMVEFKDDKSTLEVTIKMASGCDNDEEDNEIFFYSDTFSGLKGLADPSNMEDFYIKEFFYFC